MAPGNFHRYGTFLNSPYTTTEESSKVPGVESLLCSPYKYKCKYHGHLGHHHLCSYPCGPGWGYGCGSGWSPDCGWGYGPGYGPCYPYGGYGYPQEVNCYPKAVHCYPPGGYCYPGGYCSPC